MITITEEMRAKRNEKLAELEEIIDNRILEAVNEGKNRATFRLEGQEEEDSTLYSDLRTKYQNAGYYFIYDLIPDEAKDSDLLLDIEYICW